MNCAYCDVDGEVTKEHVLPQWLCDATNTYTAQVVRYSAGLRWDPNSLTVKDVCRICNNGILSQLDEYARSCWDQHFSRIVQVGDAPKSAAIDLAKLTRWLAKVSYNIARAKAHSADVDILRDLAQYILDKGPPRRRIAVYHGTLIPSAVPDHVRPRLLNPNIQTVAPEAIRLSIVDDPRLLGSTIATARIIGLHSSIFFLVVSTRPQPTRTDWSRGLRRFEKLVPMAHLGTTPLVIEPSEYDVASFDRVPMLRDVEGYARAIERGTRGFGGR